MHKIINCNQFPQSGQFPSNASASVSVPLLSGFQAKPQFSVEADYEIFEFNPEDPVSSLERFIKSVENEIHLYDLDEHAVLIYVKRN